MMKSKFTKSGQYVIDRGIPVPTRSQRDMYPWERMALGDSFFVEAKASDMKNKKKEMQIRSKIDAAWRYWAKKEKIGLTIKFSIRKLPEGFRVWRIK